MAKRGYNSTPWSEVDDQMLIDNYCKMGSKKLAALMRRGEGSICGRANALGIRKYEDTGWHRRILHGIKLYKEMQKRRKARIAETLDGRAMMADHTPSMFVNRAM